jgi:hypothetical protein
MVSADEIFGSRGPSGAVCVLLVFLDGLDDRICCLRVMV